MRLIASGAVVVVALAGSALGAPTVIFSNIASSSTSDIPGLPGLKFDTGTATRFQRPFRTPDGSGWALGAFIDITTTNNDEIIVRGSGASGVGASLVVREGDATGDGAFPGELFNDITERLAIANNGDVYFSNNTSAATTTDQAIFRASGGGFTTMVREGQATGSIPGATWGTGINSLSITSSNELAFLSSTLGGAATANNAGLFRNGGATVVAQKGITVPGSAGTAWELFDADDYSLSADGTQYIAKGDILGDTTKDDIVVVNGNAVLFEGSVIAGSTFTSPVASGGVDEVYMAPGGDWYAQGDNADTIDWVVRNGAVIARTDDVVPGGLPGEQWDDAPFASTFFFMTGNSNGEYVIGGTTNNADTLNNAVLAYGTAAGGLLNVILREGDAVDVDGNGLTDDNAFISVFNNFDGFLLENGTLHFTADLRDGAGTSIGQAFLSVAVPTPGAGVIGLAGLLLAARRRR